MRALRHTTRHPAAIWSTFLMLMAALFVAAFPATGQAAVVQACPATTAALQAAIQQAGGGGTVNFTCATPTTIPFDADRGGTGTIALGQSVTLDATGAAGGVTFDGGGKVQLFTVAAGANVTIRALALDNGLAPPVYRTPGGVADARGGAILSMGTVRIEDSTFTGNSTDGRLILQNNILQYPPQLGGAIAGTGSLTVVDSTFSGNSSGSNGGAIGTFGPQTVTRVTRSTFTGNSADGSGAAISSTDATITDSTFTGNLSGRGVVASGSTVTISGSAFTDNAPHAVDVVGGHVTVSDTQISGTNGGHSQAALYVSSGTLILDRSRVINNAGGAAGAIKNQPDGRVEIRDSVLSGNTHSAVTSGPGAIVNAGAMTIDRTTISGNTSRDGGGAIRLLDDASLEVTNSTITGNTSQASWSAGVIYISGGKVAIENSTIAGNTGGTSDGFAVGGGFALGQPGPEGRLEIGGSIIAGGDKPTCVKVNQTGFGPVAVVDRGYNLDWSEGGAGNDCGLNSSGSGVAGEDPRLGPLADNGGPTETMALRGGSPALGVIPRGDGLCPAVDQRGMSRPAPAGATTCDIGAFEGNPAIPASVFLSVSDGSPVFGQSVRFTATVVREDGLAAPTGTVQFRNGSVEVGAPRPMGANGQAVFDIDGLSVGQHTLTAHYGGDSVYPAGISNGMTVTVARAETGTTLGSSANPSTAGDEVTFTATVAPVAPGAGAPSGTVTFMDGDATLGTASVGGDGVATLTTAELAAGSHTVTATYGGNTSFQAGTSTSLIQVVNEVPALAATTTTVRSSLNPSVFGQAVTLTATVAADATVRPAGTVTFMDGLAVVGSVTLGSAGTATFRTDGLTVGSHAITAVFAETDHFAGSTSAALTQRVTITPAALCTLTSKYIQSSAKYAALGRLQRLLVDVITRSVCVVTAAVTPRLNARQRTAAIAAHNATVNSLVKQGWLTAPQGATLRELATHL